MVIIVKLPQYGIIVETKTDKTHFFELLINEPVYVVKTIKNKLQICTHSKLKKITKQE